MRSLIICLTLQLSVMDFTSREEAMEFACNKTSMWTELEIAVDYVQEIKRIEKEMEALG